MKIFLLLLVFVPLAIFGQFKVDRKYFDDLLQRGEYDRAFLEANELLKKPYGKTSHLVHYYIGKSLCYRGYTPQGKLWFQFIKDKMKTDNRFKEELAQAEHNCRPQSRGTGPTVAPTMTIIYNYVGGHTMPGGVSGKGGFTLDCRSGRSYENYDRIENNDSLEQRVFTRHEKLKALLTLQKFLPRSEYKIDTSGRFLVITKVDDYYKENDIRKAADNLEFAYLFFISRYKLRATDKLFSVYLLPTKGDLRRAAEDVHDIHLSYSNIGYSSLADLSLLGIGNPNGMGTLFHELFHLVVRSEIGDIPAWLDEGMASLYSVYRKLGMELSGDYNTWRISHFKLLMGLKGSDRVKVPSLEQLINLNWQDFEGGHATDRCSASVNYALSNLFLLFIQQRGLLTQLVEAFKKRHELGEDSLTPGPTDIELLERVFTKDIKTITNEFYDWLQQKYGIRMNELLQQRPSLFVQDLPYQFQEDAHHIGALFSRIDSARHVKKSRVKKLRSDWYHLMSSIKNTNEDYLTRYLKNLVDEDMNESKKTPEQDPSYIAWINSRMADVRSFKDMLSGLLSSTN